MTALRLELATVTGSEVDADGFVQVQHDRVGDEEDGGPLAEAAMPHGFMSRPHAPSRGPDGALTVGCNALVLEQGGALVGTMPLSDPRFADVVPDPGEGGTVIYAEVQDGEYRDTAYLKIAPDGALTVRIPYANGTKAHTLTITPGSGGTLRLEHGEGPVVVVTATDVQLGADGGVAVALAPAVQTYMAAATVVLGQLVTAVNGLAPGSVTSPVPTASGIAALKTRAT